MSSVGNILLDNEILLESGTNELEVLVFNVAAFNLGINVAKVREVLPTPEITTLAKAHPSVRGVFRLRDQVIPCVSLLDHLNTTTDSKTPESTIILTEINQHQTAFLVDSVSRIYRLNWKSVLPVPNLNAMLDTPATALTRCDGRLVVMLDFEKILGDVTDHLYHTDEVPNPSNIQRDKFHLILADDSPTIRELITTTLNNSGYTNLTLFANGSEAWQWLQARASETDRIDDIADLLVSDVEMPQIDGFHLTKLVKEHPMLQQLPVLLYSSIITPDNHKKGMAVGADAQIAKPDLDKVVGLADELITKYREKRNHTPRIDSPTNEEKAPAPVDTKPSPSPQPVSSPAVSVASATSTNVGAGTWSTFHSELVDKTAVLLEASNRFQGGDRSQDVALCTTRTLHTIKGIAQVIPVPLIAQCTHTLESLLAESDIEHGTWPHEAIKSYIDWLESMTSLVTGGGSPYSIEEFSRQLSNTSPVMKAGKQLQNELTQTLSAVGS